MSDLIVIGFDLFQRRWVEKQIMLKKLKGYLLLFICIAGVAAIS